MVNFNYKSRDVATANHSNPQPLLDKNSEKNSKMDSKGKLAAITTGLLVFVLSAGIVSSLICIILNVAVIGLLQLVYSSLCTKWERH